MYYRIVINARRYLFPFLTHLIFLSRDQLCFIVLSNKLQERTISRSFLILRPFPKQAIKKQTFFINNINSKILIWYINVSPYFDTNSSGVQVLVSALGIHFLFIGVSKVTGRMLATKLLEGRPLSPAANDFVNWWTAAFAMP